MRCAAALLALLLLATSGGAELRSESFRSPSLQRDVALAVQLPPSYDARSEARYPALYVLHGLFEDQGFWHDRGLAAVLDELWAGGAVPEFVVVAVDGGRSFFVNGPAGRYEDLVVQDAVAWAEGHLRLDTGRDARALLGVSMGGYAALRIALSRPERFGSVAAHSAMLLARIPTRADGARSWHLRALGHAFGEPIDRELWAASDPLALAARVDPEGLPALYFDCGAGDRYGLFAGNRRLHEALRARGVAHEFALPPGDHGYAYVRSVIERSLRFVGRAWSRTP